MNPPNNLLPRLPEGENPWTTLSSTEIYSNPWILLTEHQVLNPAGKPGIYGGVHFKNTAIGIVPFENDHIWMVGQYRFMLHGYSWEIPSGGGPYGEHPEQTAIRELREETGLSAKRMSPLLGMHLSNSVSDEWAIVFLATGLTAGHADPEETEKLQVRRMSLDEVWDRVERYDITDSLTVAAIYKLLYLRATGKLNADGE